MVRKVWKIVMRDSIWIATIDNLFKWVDIWINAWCHYIVSYVLHRVKNLESAWNAWLYNHLECELFSESLVRRLLSINWNLNWADYCDLVKTNMTILCWQDNKALIWLVMCYERGQAIHSQSFRISACWSLLSIIWVCDNLWVTKSHFFVDNPCYGKWTDRTRNNCNFERVVNGIHEPSIWLSKAMSSIVLVLAYYHLEIIDTDIINRWACQSQ